MCPRTRGIRHIERGIRHIDNVSRPTGPTVVSRRPPNLLWVVQNFNHFNLQNSRLTVEQVTGRGCGMETEPTYSLPYGGEHE